MKKVILIITTIYFLISLLIYIPYTIIIVNTGSYLHTDISYIVQNDNFYLLFENASTKEINYSIWLFLRLMDKIVGFLIITSIICSYFVFKYVIFPYLHHAFQLFYSIYTTENFKRNAFKASLILVISFIVFVILSSFIIDINLGINSFTSKIIHYENNGHFFVENDSGLISEVTAINYYLYFYIIKPLYYIVVFPFVICFFYLFYRHVIPSFLSRSKFWNS